MSAETRELKAFKTSEETWYCHYSLEEAKKLYCEDKGFTEAEAFADFQPFEADKHALDAVKIDDEENGRELTLREVLDCQTEPNEICSTE